METPDPPPLDEPRQPTTGRFAPARPRDKVLGVIIGSTVALIVIAVAFLLFGHPQP